MLHYAETARSSTIVPLVPQSQCPQGTTHYVSAVSSYAIGPIDPAYLLTMQAHLSTGEEYTLPIPAQMPRSILDDPAFRDGYEYNYLSEEEGDKEEEWTTMVTRMVNHIHTCLMEACFWRDLETGEVVSDFLPWQVGWLLRDLTRLAETDRLLAHVGMAHLCFLLAHFAPERPSDWPGYQLYHVYTLHGRTVKDYRSRVRVYREQGKSYDEAQRLALCYLRRDTKEVHFRTCQGGKECIY